MLLAATARIIKFNAVVVADGGEITRVEESPGIGKFGAFVAVLEATARVTDVEGNVDLFTWREWSCQLIDRVKIARARRYNLEGPAETNTRDRLELICDVNLTNWLRSLVLQDEMSGPVKGPAFGIDVDVGVDGDDLGLRNVFVLFPVTF